MSPARHPDWYTVVRGHWKDTTGFILASREPCLTIRDQEIKAVQGRVRVGRDIKDLMDWRPPESWILAVILCPGDTIDDVLGWCLENKADPTRVWFYLHPDTDYRILRPREDAGFETDQVDYVANWQGLHKLFGLALNDRVYADWKQRARRDQ